MIVKGLVRGKRIDVEVSEDIVREAWKKRGGRPDMYPNLMLVLLSAEYPYFVLDDGRRGTWREEYGSVKGNTRYKVMRLEK